MIDAIMSISTTAITAIFYTYFGINAPFIISIILSALAMIAMQVLWVENKGEDENDDKKIKKVLYA
jgi:hypothetical protein